MFKRIILCMVVTSLLALVLAVPAMAAPPIPSNAKGCLGFHVSTTTHGTQEFFGQGFGEYVHENELGTPGEVITAHREAACPSPQ